MKASGTLGSRPINASVSDKRKCEVALPLPLLCRGLWQVHWLLNGDLKMKRTMTAADIKKVVAKTCGTISKENPYWRNAAIAKDQAQTAVAYVEDARFEVSPRAASAIREWASNRGNAF